MHATRPSCTDFFFSAGMPRIFTTNKEMQWPFKHIFPAGSNPKQHAAIERRFIAIEVTQDLRKID